MIRLACLLQLVALTLALALVVRTNGLTATALVFVGAPCLALGLLLYAAALRREAARGPAVAPLSSRGR